MNPSSIILRKQGGELVPLFRSNSGRSFGTRATPGAVTRFLMSPLVLAVLAIAFLVAWMLTHPIGAVHAASHIASSVGAHGFALAGVAGSLNVRELHAKRSNYATELRAIVDKAEKEGRGLNAEEEQRYTKLFNEVDEIRKSIERAEQMAELERTLADAESRNRPAAGAPGTAAAGEQRTSPLGTPEYRGAFASWLCKGQRGMTPEEQRALAVGSDTAGGFTTAAEQFIAELIKGVDNILWIRQLARKLSVPTAQSLGTMTLDADPDDADWTSELAVGAEDAAMAFGKRKLTPHPLAKFIKVSNDFLRQTLTGGESLVRDRLGYKFGVSQEKGFMVGDGIQKALGIYTASNDGIPTSRDVSAGNLATSPTFDGLLAAKYSLKEQYWNDKLRWVFHRDVMLKISQLKDNNGQYLWRESVRAGEPDRVLNTAVAMSEYSPNVLTTGQYVGAIGNFEYYWIADAYDLAIKRLDELFALTNQVGFIGRQSVDGQPVLAEAFARVKLA